MNCIGKPDFADRDLRTQELFESKMDQIGCMKKSFRTSLKKKKEHLKKTVNSLAARPDKDLFPSCKNLLIKSDSNKENRKRKMGSYTGFKVNCLLDTRANQTFILHSLAPVVGLRKEMYVFQPKTR